MLKRCLPPKNLWQGASGGLEEQEDVTGAALRELKEETGLTPIKIEKIDFSFFFPLGEEYRHRYARGVETIQAVMFIAPVPSNQEPRLSEEHDEYKWCRFEEALKLLDWPEDKLALQRCHEIVLSWEEP